jgi:hypothetical protein
LEGLSAFGGGPQDCKIKQRRYPTTPLANRCEILGPRLTRLGSGARDALRLLGAYSGRLGGGGGWHIQKATQPRPAPAKLRRFRRRMRARARGGHQTAGFNKSGSSIFSSQTANATPTNPCYCFCILGDPAEVLKGIQEQGGRQTRRAERAAACPWSGHLNCSIAVAHQRRSERRRRRQWRVALSVRMLLSIKRTVVTAPTCPPVRPAVLVRRQ